MIASLIDDRYGIPLAFQRVMKNLLRRRPHAGTREREEARAFVQIAMEILAGRPRRRVRGER